MYGVLSMKQDVSYRNNVGVWGLVDTAGVIKTVHPHPSLTTDAGDSYYCKALQPIVSN